ECAASLARPRDEQQDRERERDAPDEQPASAGPLMEEEQRIRCAFTARTQRVALAAAQPGKVSLRTRVARIEGERAPVGEGSSRDIARAERGVAPVREQLG